MFRIQVMAGGMRWQDADDRRYETVLDARQSARRKYHHNYWRVVDRVGRVRWDPEYPMDWNRTAAEEQS